MSDCIFCKIVKGEIPSSKLYEDDLVVAFLDIMPVNKGHTLVIPKEHHETLTEIPEGTLKKLMEELQKITTAVVEATDADGFNVFMNNKEVAGQVVPHAHFHIVPRYSDDGLSFKWPTKKYEEGEAETYLNKIKSFLYVRNTFRSEEGGIPEHAQKPRDV